MAEEASSNSSSVQFSCSVISNSLRPHESQDAKPPCPSPTPWVHSDSHPSGRWCHPAISSSVVPFSPCPQSLPSSVFSNESTYRVRWPKYWSFSFSINGHPGLISFRMDWLDLLAVQGTLKSLLQHHSSKASSYQNKIQNLYCGLQFLHDLTPVSSSPIPTSLASLCYSCDTTSYWILKTLPYFPHSWLLTL